MREYCRYCGARINQRPVDGTDPDDAHGSWEETYECSNGHTGKLKWESGNGTTTTGCIAEDQEVIA